MSTLSERIKLALKKVGMSQVELARAIDVRPQAINYLCQCNPKASRYTYSIADALSVDPTWLATGEGTLNQSTANTGQQIPVLSYEDIKQELYENSDSIEECVFSDRNYQQNAFGLLLKDKSLYPRFNEGTLLIFEPYKKAKPDSIVLVKDMKSDDLFIRCYKKQENQVFLTATNKNYSSFYKSKDQKLLGVLVEARWYE